MNTNNVPVKPQPLNNLSLGFDNYTNEEISSELRYITPVEAISLLGTNHGAQRNISEKVVRKYREDMDNGLWMINGESIKISSSGQLIDGQHRLTAIISHAKPVQMMVVSGIHEDNITTIDNGKSRGFSDVISMTENVQNPRLISSAIRAIHSIKNSISSGQSVRTAKSKLVSNNALQKEYYKNENIVDSYLLMKEYGININKVLNKTAALLFFHIYRHIDKNIVMEVLETTSTGWNKDQYSPALLIIKKYQDAKSRKVGISWHEHLDYLSWCFDKISKKQSPKSVSLKAIDADYFNKKQYISKVKELLNIK